MNESVFTSLNKNDCPGVAVLKDFEMGELVESESTIVAGHLAECKICEASIQTINLKGDTLVSLLRSTDNSTVKQDDSRVKNLELFGKRLIQDYEFQQQLSNENSSNSIPPGPNLAGTTLGEYSLKEMIGRGGMGTVYKAEHQKLDKIVALKIISADCATPSSIARFRREMKLIGKLDDHPHLVKATDAGEENGTHFLAMDFIQGENLSSFVKRNGPLEIADACEAVRQTALGLQNVHEKNLTHRDIKPANLMLSEQGTIKLLDLGLARLHQDFLTESDEKDLTQIDQIVGTVDYMSPEQIEQTCEPDSRSDIYSLGCTFYFLLTGKPPFADQEEHATVYHKMRAHTDQEPPQIQSIREAIPDELAMVVHRCLAKGRAQRFQSARDLIEALEPFCENQQLVTLSRQTDKTIILNREEVIDSSLDETQQLPITKVEKRPIRKRPALLAALLFLAAGALAAFGGVIVLYTGGGTLEITVNDPDVKVTIDGKEQDQINITTNDDKVTIKLDVKSGKHRMLVSKNGFESETKEFRIVRGGNTVVSAILKPKNLPIKLVKNELKRYLDHEGEVRALDLSPDGTKFVSGGNDGHIRLWDIETGKLVKTINAHKGAIWDLSFAPDGNSVISGAEDQRIRHWDLKTGRMLRSFHDHGKEVAAVDISPDGKSFLSGGLDANLFRYDIDDSNSAKFVGYKNPGRMRLNSVSADPLQRDGHISWVRVIRYDSEGKHYLSAGNDRVIFVWDSKENKIAIRLIGHKQVITDAAFSSDGKNILSVSYDNSARYWDAKSGKQIWELDGHSAPVHAVAISPEGKFGITGGGDATIQVWNLENGKHLHTYDLFYRGEAGQQNRPKTATEMNSILCLVFLPDGKRFLSACKDGSIRMWKLHEK